MAMKYSHTAGRAYAEKDGVVFFDTDSYPVQFFPTSEAITLSAYVITYPDLMKGDAYAFARGLEGASLQCACSSFVTIGDQEWGPSTMSPGPTSGHTLSTDVVGTVPGDTDILMCRAKLTRTTSPSQINGNDIPVMFKEDEWVLFSGQDLLVERYGQMFARLFTLRLADSLNMDGTRNVIAERRQSVKRVLYTYWNDDNDETESGWSYGGTAGAYGHIVNLIESLGPSTDVSGLGTLYRRDAGSACSTADNTDYESVFTGDIEIIPGRTGINALDISGRRSVTLVDEDSNQDSDDVYTYSGLEFGPENATRRIWVAIIGYLPESGSTIRSVTGVTIGGVTATLAGDRNIATSNQKMVLAFYYADIPTGTSGSVVVTFSTTMSRAAVSVFAGYNMDNMVYHTAGAGVDGTASLNTPADGFAIGLAIANASPGTNWNLVGIENIQKVNMVTSSTSVPRFRGYEKTDGTTLALSFSAPDGTSVIESIYAISIS